MVNYMNIILFVILVFITVTLLGRILELEEAVMAREYRIRILQRNIRHQAKAIEMLRVAVAEDEEELEEGEIRPVRRQASS